MSDVATLQAEIARLERQIRVLREIDDIRDRDEDLPVGVMLLACLDFLARELQVTYAFLAYYDPYGELIALSVGQDGLIRSSDSEPVRERVRRIEDNRRAHLNDPRILDEHDYAQPLELDGDLLGIIGIGRRPPAPLRKITEEEHALVDQAASILDTEIRKRCREEVRKDELALVEQCDQIIDANFEAIGDSLARILEQVTDKSRSKASLVFGVGAQEYEPIGRDPIGHILWGTNTAVQRLVKMMIQRLGGRTHPIVEENIDAKREYRLGNFFVRSVVVQNLRTMNNSHGALVVLMDRPQISEARLQIVSRAANIIDTFLANRERQEIMARRLGDFVGNEHIQLLLNDPHWLDPRPEKVVVLLADLVGSTEYAHSESSAIEVFENINTYITMIGATVKNDFQGTLDKYIGDEVMGIFGAPLPNSDPHNTASQCAQRILEMVGELNAQRAGTAPTFEVKIILGSVEGVVGELGSHETQTDYTVIGRNVNRLFRIATHAIPGAIICNDQFRSDAEGRIPFDFDALDPVTGRGVPEPLPIHRLLPPGTADHSADGAGEADEAE